MGLGYILFTVKLNSLADFESLLIALANTYGLLLAIFSMGHGLVNIPKRIWKRGSLEAQIREIERSAVTSWETKADAEDEAEVINAEIAGLERLHGQREDYLGNWVRELALRNPDSGTQPTSTERTALNDEYLCSLTRRARKCQNQLLKAQTNWNRSLQRAGYLYDLKSASENSGLSIDWKLSTPSRIEKMIPRNVEYAWFITILPWLARSLAVLAGVVSVAIVWSEVVHNWSNPLLSLVGIIIRSTGPNWFLLEVHFIICKTERSPCPSPYCCTWLMPHIQASCV